MRGVPNSEACARRTRLSRFYAAEIWRQLQESLQAIELNKFTKQMRLAVVEHVALPGKVARQTHLFIPPLLSIPQRPSRAVSGSRPTNARRTLHSVSLAEP